MNTPRRILLIDPLGDGPEDVATPLTQALVRAGAQVRRISLPGHAEAVLDAIEQGWLPVALKPMAAAAPRVPSVSEPPEPPTPSADGGDIKARPDTRQR